MKPFKTTFLKTYGKQTRKLPAWISPENRRQAFDSTLSTDGDVSVFEPVNPARKRGRSPRVCNPKVTRPAKKKAMLSLTKKSSDDENLPVSTDCLSDQQRRKTRVKKTSVAMKRAVQAVDRETVLALIESSSDEENSHRQSSPHPLPAQQRRTTRKSRLVSMPGVTIRQRRQPMPMTSKSEESTEQFRQSSLVMKTDLLVHPPSVSRFVTRRRRTVAAKPKVPLATSSILNSSDDFAQGAIGSSRFRQPSKRRKRPPGFLMSSAENSLNAAGTVGFATNAFREVSLNESADHNLRDCSRKPIFCSTPSAGPLSKRPCLKPSTIIDQHSSPPSMSVSCIEVASTFHEELRSLGPPDLPECSAAPVEFHSDAKRQSSPSEQEYSVDLFNEPNRNPTVEESLSLKYKNYEELPSLLSEDSEGSSCFVSAAGGLEWLIEALRKKCLTDRCMVQLERVDLLHMTQLCSQTTHSFCLVLSDSAHSRQKNEHPPSVHSSQTSLDHSTGNGEIREYLHSEQSFDAPACEASEYNSQNSNLSSMDCKQSDEHSSLKVMASGTKSLSESRSVLQSKSNITESNKIAILKEKCLNDKLIVKIKNLTVSQVKDILQLKGIKPPTAVSNSTGDQKESDHTEGDPNTSVRKQSSASSEDKIISKRNQGRKKTSQAPKEKKQRSTSADRPGTSRKACVSGLSVSRWKNKGNTSGHMFRNRAAQMGGNKAVDCSINELVSTHYKQPKEHCWNQNYSTPVRTNQLNLSSLLADLTPNTHTWSRLKAALSIHRKSRVLFTPRSLCPSTSDVPQRAELADISMDLFATPFRTPISKLLHTKLHSSSSLVVCEDTNLSDAEKVYAECGQTCPLPWEECILPHRMKRCVKIGEGTFGEVFSTTDASGDIVALKIIPLEGSEKVNGEEQKTFGEILHEIIISKELSSLKQKEQNQTHGFIGLNDLHCVKGCYPSDFLKSWDNFDVHKGSENDRPDFFKGDQLFLILEFEFGGSDLENCNGTLASIGIAKSILHQVTAALAVAEQELHFEHRDLHWGNVLVKTTKEKTGSFLLNGAVHSIETRGVLVRIIDYSLSRVEIDDLTVSCDISNDEELFMGQGDYQFDIYRLMRQENGNDWSDYHPHTNVLWLHYLCSKLLSMKYRGTRGRGAKDVREELNCFYGNVLQYGSATEALQNCPMFQ